MPFKSEKQRRYLHANHPGIAKRWEQEYSGGGIARMGYKYGDQVDDMMTERRPLGNQMAYLPNSNEDKMIQSLYEMKSTYGDTPAYQKNLQKDWDNYKKTGEQLSLPKKEYSGVEGYASLNNPLDNRYVDSGMFATDARVVDDTNQGGIVDVEKVRELIENSRNQGIETTNINELPQTFDAFQDAQDKGYGQFFRNQPVDESTQWFREPTGADMISNPDFPLNKENLGGIWESGIDKGKWALSAAGAAAKMPFQLMAKAANIVNPLSPGSRNYNPDLQNQIDMLKASGHLGGGDPSGPYRITSGPLAGKNLVSGFGTNDYGRMLDKRIEYFRTRKNLTTEQTRKMHEAQDEKDRVDREAKKRSADAAAAASQRRAGKGGDHMSRSRSQGGLGISRSQAQSVSDANRAAGMSGWGL